MERSALIRREIERLKKEVIDIQNEPSIATRYPKEVVGRYVDDIKGKILECERELADRDDSE